MSDTITITLQRVDIDHLIEELHIARRATATRLERFQKRPAGHRDGIKSLTIGLADLDTLIANVTAAAFPPDRTQSPD